MNIKLAALAVFTAITALTSTLHAASGTWINAAGGSWTNTANWSGGTVAGGVDSTGFFNTLDISGTTTVTLDGAQTLGNLFFSDITAPVTNWVINPGPGGSLTLAVSTGSPKITLTNAQAVINSVISGTSGLTKAGGGILQLTATNAFTGTVIVDSTSAGGDSRLAFTTPAAFAGQNIQLGLNPGDAQNRLIASGNALTVTNNIEVRSIRMIIGNDLVGGLVASNQTWSGNVLLNQGPANVRDFFCQRDLTISGVISGGPAGLNLVSGNLFLTGQNTYTNGTTITGGILTAACPSSNAIPAGAVSITVGSTGGRLILGAHEQVNDAAVVTFGLTTTNNGRFQLNGFNETIAGIQDNGTNGNRIVEAANDGVSNKVSILTLNPPAGSNYTHTSFIRDGGTTSNSLALVKKGLGQQTFTAGAALVGYTGTTTVEQGVLELASTDSALKNSPVILGGGTILFNLTGTGVRNNPLAPITGNGTLIKSGAGALVLDTVTTNTFTGATIVSNGTLQVKGILSGNAATVAGGTLENLGELQATSVTVNGGVLVAGSLAFPTALISGPVTINGGTLRGWAIVQSATLQSGTINPGTGTSTDTLTISNLTLAAGSTLSLDVDPLSSGATDLIPTANLTVAGPAAISFAIPVSGSFALSRYVVMTYSSSASGLGNLSLTPTIAGRRYGLAIDTSVPGEVAITVANPSGTPQSLAWVGNLNAGAWDINSTINWLDSSTPEKFYNADAVTFDDTAANTAVNVTTTVYPGLVAFNNSASNYTASGAGKIVATAGLSKTGSGNLTLRVPYEGGAVTNAGGGTLSLTNSTIGTRLLINSGSTVSLTGTNFFNGSFVVDAANTGGSTLLITNGGYLNAPVTGGSFNLVNSSNQIVVAGAGSVLNVPGVGAIQLGNTANSTGNRVILRDGGAWTNIPGNVVLPSGAAGADNHLILTNGGQLVWSPTGGNLLLGHSAGALNNSLEVLGSTSVLDLNGKGLYAGRQGTNNVAIISGGVATNVAVINVNDTGAGQGNGVRVLNGGRLYSSGGINLVPNANTSVGAFLTVDNASVWANTATIGGNAAATGTLLTLTNGGSLTISNTLTVNNASSGVNFSSGTLTAGTVSVNNGLIFTVGNGVNAATLALTGGSSTFANNLVISANATLKGSGKIATGNVTVSGAFTPGASVGVLTFSNNLALAGSTVMELDQANATNDSAIVVGTLTYGGTLTVTNLGGTLAAGDTFKLFNAPSYANGSFSGVTLPTLAPGLGWTNKLAINGTIAVVATVSTTPFVIGSVVKTGKLELTWPADHTGWRLQVQTNSLSTGLHTNWSDVVGSTLVNSVTNVIGAANGCVFYRMVYP